MAFTLTGDDTVIEFDDEPTSEKPAKWWELLDDAAGFVRFHYSDIMEHGSDELKRAAEIVLGGSPPGIYKKGETA